MSSTKGIVYFALRLAHDQFKVTPDKFRADMHGSRIKRITFKGEKSVEIMRDSRDGETIVVADGAETVRTPQYGLLCFAFIARPFLMWSYSSLWRKIKRYNLALTAPERIEQRIHHFKHIESWFPDATDRHLLGGSK